MSTAIQSFWDSQFSAEVDRQIAYAAERGVDVEYSHGMWRVRERGNHTHTASTAIRPDAARVAYALARTFHHSPETR